MQVEVFTKELVNDPEGPKANVEVREKAAHDLMVAVNNCLTEHPDASVQWMQSSGASKYGAYTQLTAIVSYP